MKKKIIIIGIILFSTGIMLNPCIASDSTRPITITSSEYPSIFLEEPGTLSGHVTDAEMNPIEGALIRVDFHETYRENYSDATGYYHVTDIPICYCIKNATCSKQGYIPETVSLAISENTIHNFTLTSTGPWLYVGGSGPGNYTKIQDAIDNASIGDTVFVYDDSSPYVENILVDVPLSLIGEEKNTTVIDGDANDSVQNFSDYFGVYITADNVVVQGFTVQNCNLSGIEISSNHTVISDTILINNRNYGIVLSSGDISQPSKMSGDNTITNNLITNNLGGIIVSGQNNIIKGNVISENDIGITVMLSIHNNISYNTISRDTTGVYLIGSYKTLMYRNNISQNDVGVSTMMTSADKILQNNFIENNKSASATQMVLIQLYYRFKGELSFPLRRNIWNENYWDKPRNLPYKSPGLLWFFIYWHPAQAPYPIEE